MTMSKKGFPMQKIAAIINFCSNEFPYLKECVEHLDPICDQIIVPVCDHFFNGKKEDQVTLLKIFSSFPNVKFIQYPHLGKRFSKKILKKNGGRIFDGVSRFIGSCYLDSSMEYVLFIDADEIIDPDRFQQWKKDFPLDEYQALKFENYWYFREEKYQATTTENSILLVEKKALSKKVLFGPDDRDGIFKRIEGKKNKNIFGDDQKPLFHHYSWVRTKEQMLRKVLSWGHRHERNWEALVEEEFSRPFNGKDFVHGYEFITTKPYIILNLNDKPSGSPDKTLSNLLILSEKQALKNLSLSLWLEFVLESAFSRKKIRVSSQVI